jgi:parvulin-like peptidyl-prolyl isomerase
MSQSIAISSSDILKQLKLSLQVLTLVKAVLSSRIITTTAAHYGIEVAPEELQQAADNLRIQNQLLSAEATWAWLNQQGLSIDDFEELAYMTLLSSKLARHLFSDKVEAFFAEHLLDYTQVALYEVVLSDPDLAMELFYALQENEVSFAEVARRYIQDPELRRSGGYRGLIRRVHLKPEISTAVFAASPPQLLKPIVISNKAYLIWVEEVIQPQLDEELRSQILTDLFENWLCQKIDQTGFQLDLELHQCHTIPVTESES